MEPASSDDSLPVLAQEATSPKSAKAEHAAEADQGFPVFVPDGVVNVDGEVALIVFRASGGTCG